MAYELDLRVSATTGDAINNLERVQDSVRNVSSATTQAGNTISQSMSQATVATQDYGKAMQNIGKIAQNINTQGIVQGINAITQAINGDGGAKSIIEGFTGTVGGIVSMINPAVGAVVTAGGKLIATVVDKFVEKEEELTEATDDAREKKVAEYIETLKTSIYEFSGTAQSIVEGAHVSKLTTDFVSFYTQIAGITGTEFDTVKNNTETLYASAKKYWYILQGKDENGQPLSAMTKEEREKYLEPIFGEGGLQETLNTLGIHLFKENGRGGYDLQYDEETLYNQIETVFLALDGLYGLTTLFKKGEDGKYEYQGNWNDAKIWLENNSIYIKDYVESLGYSDMFGDNNELNTDFDIFKSKLSALNTEDYKALLSSFSVKAVSVDESGNVVIKDWGSFLSELETKLNDEETRKILTSAGIDVFKDAEGNWRIADQFLNAEQELTTKMNAEMANFLHGFGIDFFKDKDGNWYCEDDWPNLKTKLEELAKDEGFVNTLKSFGVDIFEKQEGKYVVVSDYDNIMQQLQSLSESIDLTTLAESLGLDADNYLTMITRINDINNKLAGMGATIQDLTTDKHTIEVSAELALSSDIAKLATDTLAQVQAVYSGFVESEIIQNDATTGMSYWLTKFFRGECTAEELASEYSYYYIQSKKAQKLGEQIAGKAVDREEALDNLGQLYMDKPWVEEVINKYLPEDAFSKAFELYGDNKESIFKYINNIAKENGAGTENLTYSNWMEVIEAMSKIYISEEEKGWIDELALIEQDMAEHNEQVKEEDRKKNDGTNPDLATENVKVLTGTGSTVVISGSTSGTTFNTGTELNNSEGGNGLNPNQYYGNVDNSTYNGSVVQGDQYNTYNYVQPEYNISQD